ncbi:hypothetical protein ACWFR1_23105 [Streptomyces sp. NPDC055103]
MTIHELLDISGIGAARDDDGGTAAPSPDDPERKVRRNEEPYVQRRALLLHLLRNHLAKYGVGTSLPGAGALADEIGQQQRDVAAAMVQLDQLGEVVYNRSGLRRLGPQEHHPDDVALDRVVRSGIQSGAYRPGTPLPTAILAARHGLTLEKVPRALRMLIRDRLVACWDGPVGRGYYVLPTQGAEKGARAARAPALNP